MKMLGVKLKLLRILLHKITNIWKPTKKELLKNEIDFF